MDSELVFFLPITESGRSIGMECTSFGAKLLRFTSQIYHMLAVCPWGSCLAFLCLRLLSYRMRIMLGTTAWVWGR